MTLLLLCIALYILVTVLFQIGLVLKANSEGNRIKETYDWNPFVSILIPCFNEEKSIVSSVEACINQTYSNYNIIIINDGSTDSSLDLLIDKFELSPIINKHTVYADKARKIFVIDKENGGKFTALNAGIELSVADRILAVDADSLLVPEALETIVSRTDPQSVASTAGIGMINGSTVESGVIKKNKLSLNPLVASQTIEYLRTFVMLKLSLSRHNGIMVLSGACSFFSRDFIKEIGGYKQRITEDAEITLRIHDWGGKIQFIPEILSYTECPNNIKELEIQRNRWIRGIIRDAWEHKKLMKMKGALGRFMMPYFYITDVVSPWLELAGWLLFVATLFIGTINLLVIVLFFCFIVGLHIINNLVLLKVSRNQLSHFNDISNMWFIYLIGVIDLIYYRPIMIFIVISSQLREIFKSDTSWGVLKRKGF